MSRFFSERFCDLDPYVPGEQPKDQQYIKLNTNESPFPPPAQVAAAVSEAANRLMLYPDPEGLALRAALAEKLGVSPEEVILGNGSDEILNFAFAAFCDEGCPALFPDVTYGFYPVFARMNRVPYRTIPLREDFSVNPQDYAGAGGTVFLANPNAPTGLFLPLEDIRGLLSANPDQVLAVDEAYVDFGGQSAVPLIREYENLLVVRTFSKSRSMAGARLGFGVGNPALIRDLNTLRNSTNPYNVNGMTLAAGLASLKADEYNLANCRIIEENRAYLTGRMRAMGFELTDSLANFVFARHGRLGGGALYRALRARGILVRYFDAPRTRDYVRITVGTREQMDALLAACTDILEEV